MGLTIDTETTTDEAYTRKVLVNTCVLRGRAPRTYAKLDDYKEKLLVRAEELEFPCGPGCIGGCEGSCLESKAYVLRNVKAVPRRAPNEYDEFKDHLFSRHEAYRIR